MSCKTVCLLLFILTVIGNQLDDFRPEVFYDDPVEICLLSEVQDSDSYEKSFDFCKKKYPNSSLTVAFGGLKTFYTAPPGFCCTVEIGLGHRGYTSLLDGFSISKFSIHPPLHRAFEALHSANISVLSIGDSTSSQMVYAIIAELSRKAGPVEDVTTLVKEQISRTVENVDKLYGAWKWKNVFIYSVNLFHFHDTETRQAMETAAYGVIDRHSSLVIIANLGHHLADYLLPSERNGLLEIMSTFITWLNKLQSIKRGIAVIYKETSPSHFESIDGTYQLWKNPNPNQTRESLPSDTEFPLYNCKQLGPSVQNRRDNVVANHLIQRLGFKFPVLKVFEYFKDYWKMHSGNCYYFSKRTDVIDCVHLCQYSRPMWFSIWSQLDEMIPKIASQMMVGNDPDTGNVAKLNTDIHFIQATSMRASASALAVPSVQEPLVVSDVAVIRSFISCGGVWHEIYTNQTLSFLRHQLPGAATIDVHKPNDPEWQLIGAPCLDSTRLVENKVMLTTFVDPSIYILTDGVKKARVPSRKVVEQLGSNIAIPVETIPACQLDLIEETKFSLDDITSCGHKFAFLRVVTAGTRAAMHYLKCDCEHHLISDKATMIFLHERLQASLAAQNSPERNIVVEERVLPKGQQLADVGVPCISTARIADGKVMLTTPEDAKTVFIVARGKRKARIPSHEIFQKLGGAVIIPVETIPACQLNLFDDVEFVLSDFYLNKQLSLMNNIH